MGSIGIEAFVLGLKNHDIDIQTQTNLLKKLQGNCSGLDVPIQGYVCPENKSQLKFLVNYANKYHVPLFPFSGGYNWGFGSKVPTKKDCVLVDLKKLNRILEVNPQFGYAVIEAGVTQMQLYERLKIDAPAWFFDVTGSSSHSTIVGNSLERGIAYNTQRVNLLSDFEVLLGRGEFLKTGCGQFHENKMTHLYRHGLGPSLESLFYQSNFGIVTQATVTLTRRPAQYDFVSIPIKDTKQIPALVESLGGLLRDGVIQCIPHIFNRDRLLPVIAPLWKKQIHSVGKMLSDTEIEVRLKKIFPGAWFAVLGLGSAQGNIQEARKKIKKALPPGLKAYILTSRQEAIKNFIADYFPFSSERRMLFKATRPSRALVRGIPTDETLQSIAWPYDKNHNRVEATELDNLNSGFIFCTPFAPLIGENAQEIIEIASTQARRFGFEPAISLNLIDRKILEGVISLHFDKRIPEQAENAKKGIRAMHEEFLKCGFLPYRLDVDSMDLLSQLGSKNSYLWKEIKGCFDPNNIISPGRYDSYGEENAKIAESWETSRSSLDDTMIQ